MFLLQFATSISISSTRPAAHSHRDQTGPHGGEPCPAQPWWDRTAHVGLYKPIFGLLTPDPHPGLGQNDMGASPGEREQTPLPQQHPVSHCCLLQVPGQWDP